MADNVTVDNGDGTDYTVSSDEGAGGHVQRTKLAYSADGSETHVTADADGLLVNLGANNDVTVTGTVTANAGTGTLAVSAASLPLPSGAATAAKQPALGTAGTASADVITVQGVASMTALTVADGGSTLSVDDGGSTISIDDGGAAITVDGTVAVSGTVTVDLGVNNDVTVTSGSITADTELPTAAALADNASNPTTPTVGSALLLFDGSTWDRARTGVGDAASSLGLVQNLPMLWNGSTHDRMPGSATDGVTVNLGSNNDVTVTGTVTANLAAGTNNIGDVDIASIAAGDNNIGNVDVASIAAGDNNIGNVDIASALPAGTNAIGKLAANSGVDIGDVDVTSIIPGTGATNSGKAVDGIAGATDTGTLALFVRDDALATLTPADGDYTQGRTDSTGALWIRAAAGTAAIGTLAANSGVDIGDVTINNASGAAAVNIQDGGNTITVDGTVAATQSGTWNIGSVTTLPALVAGTANIGDVDVASIAAGDNNIGNVDVVTLPSIPAGTNNIGDVDVLTLPALAAGTNTIGIVRNKESSGTLDDAGTDRTVKYAIIDAASSGDNTLVAAVASRKLRVLSAFLVSSGSVNVRFESGAAGTALSGQMNLVANTGFVLPYNPHGWFETASNTLLNLELSGATSVDGSLTYVEIA
jgi:hypothetical protein